MNDPVRCEWCGNFHQFKCPLIKSLEYENGLIKRVEFFAPTDYPKFEVRTASEKAYHDGWEDGYAAAQEEQEMASH